MAAGIPATGVLCGPGDLDRGGPVDGLRAIGAAGLTTGELGALDGRRLRARAYRQVCPEPAAVPPCSDHILVYHIGGGARVERYYDGKRTELRDGRRRISTVPAERLSEWRFPAEIEVLHLYIDALRLRGFAAGEFGLDPQKVEVTPAIGAEDPAGRALATVILTEMRGSADTARLLIDAMEQAVALHLLRAYAALPFGALKPKPLVGGRDRRIDRALELIEARIDQDIGLDELAAAACLSPFHFSRCFRASVGETPHAYLMSRRVARARDLLARTELTLAEIAYACGFASQSHFTAAFKRRVGTTPGAFRRAAS